jgi:heterodisulfide reductase subunit A-like polyferredoxin/coenzyme F420-reducing hydrogenase delta subunit
MDTRIGVFLCNCGGAIKNIDFDAVAKKVAKFPGVTCVNLRSDLCLEEGKKKMISCIREENIEKVVVAACSPEFTEHIFREVLEKSGLNGHLLSMANIREQCSWVHEGDVTVKAVELVKMAVNKVRFLQPMEKKAVPVNREVLVVGGGFSAINVALQLSRVGLRTTLLEKETVLGDGLEKLESFYGFYPSSMISAVEEDRNIEVLTSAQMIAIEGNIGDFGVKIGKGGEEISRKYGAIILATGYKTELTLDSEPKLRTEDESISGINIGSQEQFCRMLRNPSLKSVPKTIGFMFDFSDENSRFPTLATLNNALAAKKKWGSEVYVFYKSVKVDSEGVEKLYQEARDCGVVFLRSEIPPKITAKNGRVKIEAKDVFLGEDVILACDILVAEELYLPAEGTETLSSLLNIRIDSRGFFQDENVHLYPVTSERKGIFFIGGCRDDLDLGRVLTDISSVVMNVYELLSSGKIPVDMERVKANPQKCVACLTCIRVCPHGAIQLIRADNSKEVAGISDLACDACGICAAICPAKAIKFQGYRDEEILAQIEAIGESSNGRIVAFCCEHSAYPAADLAGKLRLHYPENLRVIRVPCAGQVDVFHILKAFEKGAATVLVMGCEDGACHHITGNTRAKERVNYCNMLLKEVRVDGRPVAMFNVSPNAPHKFVRAVNEITKITKESGR